MHTPALAADHQREPTVRKHVSAVVRVVSRMQEVEAARMAHIESIVHRQRLALLAHLLIITNGRYS